MKVLMLLIGEAAALYVWAALWVACAIGYVWVFREIGRDMQEMTAQQLRVQWVVGLLLLVLALTASGQALPINACDEGALQALYGSWWWYAGVLRGCWW